MVGCRTTPEAGPDPPSVPLILILLAVRSLVDSIGFDRDQMERKLDSRDGDFATRSAADG